MTITARLRHVAATAFAVISLTFGCAVYAQTQAGQAPVALPTAPGADRAVKNAPPSAARASLRGDNGSPLEPYLFTFILAGGGLIAFIGVRLTDARVRKDGLRPT